MGASPQPLLATSTMPTIPNSAGDEVFGARSSMVRSCSQPLSAGDAEPLNFFLGKHPPALGNSFFFSPFPPAFSLSALGLDTGCASSAALQGPGLAHTHAGIFSPHFLAISQLFSPGEKKKQKQKQAVWGLGASRNRGGNRNVCHPRAVTLHPVTAPVFSFFPGFMPVTDEGRK